MLKAIQEFSEKMKSAPRLICAESIQTTELDDGKNEKLTAFYTVQENLNITMFTFCKEFFQYLHSVNSRFC